MVRDPETPARRSRSNRKSRRRELEQFSRSSREQADHFPGPLPSMALE